MLPRRKAAAISNRCQTSCLCTLHVPGGTCIRRASLGHPCSHCVGPHRPLCHVHLEWTPLCSSAGPVDIAAGSSRGPTPLSRQRMWHCLLSGGFPLHLMLQAFVSGSCFCLLQPGGPSCTAIPRACTAGQLHMTLRLPFPCCSHVSLLIAALYWCRACTLRSRQPLTTPSPSQAMPCCSTLIRWWPESPGLSWWLTAGTGQRSPSR